MFSTKAFMDKNTNYDRKYFQNSFKKKQNVLKSINNYLSQLKMHFEISDEELADILKTISSQYKKSISSKKWWQIFD